jgi:hypothetical protein
MDEDTPQVQTCAPHILKMKAILDFIKKHCKDNSIVLPLVDLDEANKRIAWLYKNGGFEPARLLTEHIRGRIDEKVAPDPDSDAYDAYVCRKSLREGTYAHLKARPWKYEDYERRRQWVEGAAIWALTNQYYDLAVKLFLATKNDKIIAYGKSSFIEEIEYVCDKLEGLVRGIVDLF